MTAAISRARHRLDAALAAVQEAATAAMGQDEVTRKSMLEGQMIERHRLAVLLRHRAEAFPAGSPVRRELMAVLWDLAGPDQVG